MIAPPRPYGGPYPRTLKELKQSIEERVDSLQMDSGDGAGPPPEAPAPSPPVNVDPGGEEDGSKERCYSVDTANYRSSPSLRNRKARPVEESVALAEQSVTDQRTTLARAEASKMPHRCRACEKEFSRKVRRCTGCGSPRISIVGKEDESPARAQAATQAPAHLQKPKGHTPRGGSGRAKPSGGGKSNTINMTGKTG